MMFGYRIKIVAAVGLLLHASNAPRHASVVISLEPVAVTAGSKLGGVIADVLASPGQRVRQGQVVVRFESGRLMEQQHTLQKALRIVQAAIESSKMTASLSPSVRTLLLNSHPDVLRAEDRYVSALSGANQADLDRASAERQAVRLRISRSLSSSGELAGTASLLEARLAEVDRALAECEVRAPADSVIDILDLHPGDRIIPGAPTVVFKIPGQYVGEFVAPSQRVALRAGAIARAQISGQESTSWRVESVSHRTIPLALRENRQVSEEVIVTARLSSETGLAPGTLAELQMP